MPTVSSIIVPTSSESSGRRTLLDIIDDLSRPVNGSDDTVRALAADAFRAAVRTMNRRGMWPWEVQSEDITLTAGLFSTVSSPVKKPLAMHFTNGAGGNPYQPIAYVTYDRFCELYSHDLTGQPNVYTIPNLFETGQVQWFPQSGGTYYARFHFYRVTPAPRSEDEAVEIPDYAIESYMSLAWYEFAKRLPPGQRPFPIEIALGESRQAFREMSAHVNSVGDRSRITSPYG